jgi:peptide/nickel transport system substrate-binding protein
MQNPVWYVVISIDGVPMVSGARRRSRHQRSIHHIGWSEQETELTQDQTSLETLRESILAGRLTRRGVLKRAVALGLSAPVIAGLLAACGDDEEEGGDEPEATSGGAGSEATGATGDATEATDEGEEAEGEATEATSGEAPSGMTRGQFDMLRLLVWQAPTILNTHFSQGDKDGLASRLVLEPLVNIMSDGTLVPVLAAEVPSLENGGVAEDGLSVTWKLKEGVVWSDGTPFTAEDVEFTWQYITDEATAATTFATYEIITGVEVVDEHTITFTFAEPNPLWFGTFSGSFYGAVLPKHILGDAIGEAARNHEFNLNPIGTGPYVVTEFRPGDTVLYEANENFREADKPYFARVELKGGGDATSAARAVATRPRRPVPSSSRVRPTTPGTCRSRSRWPTRWEPRPRRVSSSRRPATASSSC